MDSTKADLLSGLIARFPSRVDTLKRMTLGELVKLASATPSPTKQNASRVIGRRNRKGLLGLHVVCSTIPMHLSKSERTNFESPKGETGLFNGQVKPLSFTRSLDFVRKNSLPINRVGKQVQGQFVPYSKHVNSFTLADLIK